MSYNPVNWVNGETPINDVNLNNMDQGILEAHKTLANHDKKIDGFANQQLPEEYLKEAVDTYVSENEAGLFTKAEGENLNAKIDEEVGKLSSEIVGVENEIEGMYLDGVIYPTWENMQVRTDGSTQADDTQLSTEKIKVKGAVNIYSKVGTIRATKYYADGTVERGAFEDKRLVEVSGCDSVRFSLYRAGKNITPEEVGESIEKVTNGTTSLYPQLYKEVMNLKSEGDYTYIVEKKSNNLLYIYYKSVSGYVRYKYFLHTDNELNLNTWQMGAIDLCDYERNVVLNMSADNYDNEGVIQVDNEFIGGVHGNEHFTNVWLFINGKPIAITDIGEDIYCKSIKFIVESDIYRVSDTETPTFAKVKQTTFDSEGIHVNNHWTCKSDVHIDKMRAILLSINKSCISYYYDSVVNKTPMVVPENEGGFHDARMIDTFYSGLCFAHVWVGKRGGSESGYDARISDFTVRLKSYFDCYTDYDATENEDLYCENNFIVEY